MSAETPQSKTGATTGPTTGPWLTLIGMGEGGFDSLSRQAAQLLRQSQTLVVGERLEDLLDTSDFPNLTRILNWSAGLRDTLDALLLLRGTPVTVLATGDPMHFGIGATLLRHVPASEMRILPSPSAFSLAAARLGWPLQQVAQISLHGRPVEHLVRHLMPRARIIALTTGRETAKQVAHLLVARGCGSSVLTVLSHMGGQSEKLTTMTASAFVSTPPDIDDLHVLAIDCEADGRWLSPIAGLPDDAFRHDGQLTRREARAAILSLFSPFPNAHLWDVGAGCGSVAVEWLRFGMGVEATAIEQKRERVAMIEDNAAKLGVPDLVIIEGEAPDALECLAQPDVIFIGGGITRGGVFEACWQALRPGGRLVASAETIDSEAQLAALRGVHGGELVRIQVSRAGSADRQCGWKSLMPVTIWSVSKGAGE